MNSSQNKIKVSQILISGFALFAIFFGAGNLIFPPYLGLKSADQWFLASLGFNLSDSVLILIGILAISRRKGNLDEFGGKVSKNFGTILSLICISLVGPLLSVPRTCATTFEVGVQPFYPSFNKILFSLIFFTFVYILTINGSKVIDRVGKYLTPILLLILAILIIKGIKQDASIKASSDAFNFSTAFIEGYQTMDSLGPVFTTLIILEDFKNKGIRDKNQLVKFTIYAGLIAVIGLIIVYTGLCFIGAKSSSYISGDPSRTSLLISISQHLLGRNVQIALSMVVGFACLSTAIGLLSAFASNFSKKFTKKDTYKTFVIIGTLISFVLSILGVEKIMEISKPILLLIYPIVISLYFLNLIDNGSIDPLVYKVVTICVSLVSLADMLRALGFKDNFYVNAMAKLPLAESGFAFVFVFLIGFILSYIFTKLKRSWININKTI